MDSRPIILVVEDEPLIGLTVEDALGEAGYDVRLLSQAVDALHELEGAAEVLSALVTDIRLQGDKDGWQVARRARELNPMLPVVYMSVDSELDHSYQGLTQSVIVQTPFEAAHIFTSV